MLGDLNQGRREPLTLDILFEKVDQKDTERRVRLLEQKTQLNQEPGSPIERVYQIDKLFDSKD